MEQAQTDEIRPGDAVTLASGGMPMTVYSIKDEAACVGWFTADGDLKDAVLPICALRKATCEDHAHEVRHG